MKNLCHTCGVPDAPYYVAHFRFCKTHKPPLAELDKAYIKPFVPAEPSIVIDPPKKPAQRVMEPHYDITESHHGGNAFSTASNPEREKKARDMQCLYDEYVRRGPAGAIREDVYLSLGYTVQTGSARCSDLARNSRIVAVLDDRGKRKYGRTRTDSPAGIECADIYARQLVKAG